MDSSHPPGVAAPVLDVADLTVRIAHPDGPVFPVRGVNLRLGAGETLGLVGESGCGKTLTCLAVMGLLGPPVSIAGGAVRFRGQAVDGGEAEARRHLSRGVGMVFQNPMTGLNPVRSIGWQVAEAYRIRTRAPWRRAREKAVELMDLVGIPEPRRRARDYPHQLSGGQQQRVMIAMAIAGEPRLLLADEPTTALDVTVQAQILDLLARLRREIGMALLFVTHDLGLVARMADRVAIMYAGRVVETGPAEALFERPCHPYTRGLLDSLPLIDEDVARLSPIEGTLPPLAAMPTGCAFAPRCARRSDRCRAEAPELAVGARGQVACHHPLAAETAAA